MTCMSQLEIEDAAVAMIEQRGRAIMERVKQDILNTTYDHHGSIDLALQHYAKVNLPLVMPIFPALMSLSYEATTGVQKNTVLDSVSVAMMFIAFSADIHDDIIDKSDVKYAKKTVCGKFGSEIALLASDVLLIHGHTLLYQACETLSSTQRQEISLSVSKALFELSSAEALEFKLSKEVVVAPDEHFEVMRLKGVFAELQCRLGGIIGQANGELLEDLVRYGRAVGMFGAIKDEFSDMLNVSELVHRIKFECPPLPLVYAVADETVKAVLGTLVEQFDYSKIAAKKVAKLILGSKNVYGLKQKINEQISQELKNLDSIKKSRAEHDIFLLLRALSIDA